MKTNTKKKIILLTIIGTVVTALTIFFVMLFTVKPSVIGVWQGEVKYLEKYGCDTIRTVEFEADGDATSILIEAQTGTVLNIDTGYWSLSGFEASFKETGEIGTVCYDFNPITRTIKNGRSIYRKIG